MLKIKSVNWSLPVLLLFLMPGCSTTEKCGQKTAPAVQATEAHVKNAPYRVRGKRYTPMSVADALQYSETGYASWYGGKGRSMKTSSGEYINPQRSMTAAHKTLPMPCKVKVTCLATLVKQYRAKYPHVLLVDSGDYFMGNPYVDDWEKRGEPLTVLMNKLKYDIVTIGNHDLDYGQEALRDHIKGMPGTKFVVTNVNPSPTLENCFSPYASIPIKGTPISIGFIGLVDLQTTDVRRMSGISWKLPDEEDYKGITDRFRLHHNTINVILSHLGYDHDLKMMKYSPNIDVILGGHTHVMLPHGHLRTGTLLSYTGHRLSHAGVTEITFSTEKPASILSKSTKAVSLDERIPSDPEVEKIVQQFTGNPFFNQQVGVAGEDITHVTVGTFFCKAIQQASHSDIAIYNRGGVRARSHLCKGPIKIKDIYEMEPFREKVVTCSMSKADIEQLILSKFMSPSDDEGGILEVYCSGFSYQIMDGVTPSITSTLKNGVIYTVAMGDYLCNNFKFPQKGNGKPTGISVRSALIEYLKQIKELFNPPPPKLPIIKDTTFAL